MEMITIPYQKQPVKIVKDSLEKSLWKQGKVAIGIDEVGRGCLAGPLVAAAAILPIRHTSSLLKDSKLMSPHERLKAYGWISKHCHYQVGIVHHRIIDQHNIYQATILAMKRALVGLLSPVSAPPGAILVDAIPLTLSDTGFNGIPVYYFPKGEQKSSSIAAASIVAKVTRDALMEKYEMLFPGYELAHHKGYATAIHRNHIQKLRHSIIHRESFLGAVRTEMEVDEDEQQTLF